MITTIMPSIGLSRGKKTAFEMSPRGKRTASILFMSVITSLILSNLLLSGRSIPENSLRGGRVSSSFLPEGLHDEIIVATPVITSGRGMLPDEPDKRTIKENQKKMKARGVCRRTSGDIKTAPEDRAQDTEDMLSTEPDKKTIKENKKKMKARGVGRRTSGDIKTAPEDRPQDTEDPGRLVLETDASLKVTLTTHSAGTNVEHKTICFTTSIFGPSAKAVDKPQDVRKYFPESKPSEYDFILFTNLEDLPALGWKKIVKADFPYRRFITQSRWGKFVGWRDEGLSHCGTVMFSDGYVLPKKKSLHMLRKVAEKVAQSELGLAQVIHHRTGQGIDNISKSVLKQKKDLPENAKVTLKWLRTQPDFDKYMPYYLGKYFVYDPSNPKFREVSSYFWDMYSQEKGMWRDQPLWSYAIHHFNVKPVVLMDKQNGDYMNGGNMFIEKKKSRGFGGHRYGADADNNAAVVPKPSDTRHIPLDFGTSDTQQQVSLLDFWNKIDNNATVATFTSDTREVLPVARGGTICFVTSIFGNDEKSADKPPDVRKLFPDSRSFSDYDFILFTNMENVTANGWKQIVKKDLPYRRFITQSRWGKFVGWRHEGLSHCGMVVYFDGYVMPNDKKGLEPFRKLAEKVTQSELGLAQVTHFWDGKQIDWIFRQILKSNKDVPTNVEASLKWFNNQTDFNNNFPYYLNKWFAYDPSNPRFREMSSFFWDRYSQEVDSWRDQPLWSYSIHHFKTTPVVLLKGRPRSRHLLDGGDLFIQEKEQRGFAGHVYNKGHDNDAERFRQEQEPNVNNNGKETSNKTSDFPPLAGKTPGNDAAAAT